MRPEILFDHFNLLTDAPNSVLKLRELILQLAVQGKLVPQDPNDEPASELLERIQTEKAYLIKKKKIKRSKPLPPIETGEVPYDLPDGWKWTKLDPVTINVHYGYTAKADRFITDVRMLRITDIQNNRVDWSSVPGCEIDDGTFLGYELRDGDILIARTGGTIGKTYLVKGISDRAVFASYLIRVVPSPEISAEYLKLFAESPIYWKQLIEKSSGTGQPNVNSTSLRSLILPLPPLNEQKRIVTKINQLMALCDELEAQQEKAAEERNLLVASALDGLLSAEKADGFAARWRLIAENFDLLFDTPEHIEKLRAAILQLAVQGKLVRQDANDEPASELLKRIQLEKAYLIQKKKIKRTKPLPSIAADEVPYDLPKGWQWTRLGELCRFIDYRGKTPQKTNSGVRLITAKNVRMGYLQEDPREYISPNDYETWMTRGFPRYGDVLFTTEAPLGNVAQLLIRDKIALAQRIINLQAFADLCQQFLKFVLMSPPVQDSIQTNATGITAQGIKAAKLKLIEIPLPPLEEQKRIVTKVDQFMTLCDELEARLKSAQEDGEKLLAAAVNA